MRIGVVARRSTPTDELLEMAKKAEKLGFESLWVNSAPWSRDPFLTLLAVAQSTKKIDLGVGIVDVYSKNPITIASSASTLSDFAKRNLTVAVGSSRRGHTQSMGLPFTQPAERVGEFVHIIKRLTRGENVTLNGHIFRLRNVELEFRPKKEIPILVGAQSLKMIEMTAKYADGVLGVKATLSYVKHLVENLRVFAKKHGRGDKDLRVSFYACMGIYDDADVFMEKIKPVIAAVMNRFSPSVRKYIGLTDERLNDYLRDPQQIPEKLVEEIAICGSEDECVRQIGELERIGVNEVLAWYPVREVLYQRDTAEEIEIRNRLIEDIGMRLLPLIRSDR